MKKLRLTRLLAVILAVIMVLPLFAACNKNRKYDNEKDQLVVGLEEPDGVFNSFFATSGNDTTVAGTVAASLISMDKNAKIVCGPEYPSVALDFMQKVTYDPSNPNATEVIDGVTYTDYYFVLKNKVKYSDGTPLTIASKRHRSSLSESKRQSRQPGFRRYARKAPASGRFVRSWSAYR